MSKLDHLVVGMDGSAGSERALRWAAAQSPKRLTLVHAFSAGKELLSSAFTVNLDPIRSEREEFLSTAWSAAARLKSIEVETVVIDDDPAPALVAAAARWSADGIVIGHQGHGRWSEHHVGGVAGQLLHRCDVPLILTSDETTVGPMNGPIIVGLSRPVDDPPELAWALDVAEFEHAQVHLVSLVEQSAFFGLRAAEVERAHAEVRTQMDALIGKVRLEHREIGISTEVSDGPAVEQLSHVAKELRASMVVVGSHHPGRLAGRVGGSVARLLPPLLECPLAAIPVNGSE